MADQAKQMQQAIQRAAADIKEYNENIKSPFLELGVSVATTPALSIFFWPLDVLKNHVLAGKGAKDGFKKQFSFKGIGFGLMGASVIGANISQQYITNFGEEFSTTKKAMIGLAPAALLPIGCVLESLKLNSQINQLNFKDCLKNSLKSGYRGVFRGFVPYSTIFGLTYGSYLGYILLSTKKSPQPGGQPRLGSPTDQPGVSPLLLLYIVPCHLVCTYLDIIKTRTMLGQKLNLQTLKVCPKLYAAGLAVNTLYFALFSATLGMVMKVVEGQAYAKKVEIYTRKKKAKMFAKEDEYDSFVPLDTADLTPEEILIKSFIRDG